MKTFAKEVAACFAGNLRRCRRRAGLSQEELGFRASIHRTEVGVLERGGRIPQLYMILKLSSGLSISPDELIEGIAWKPGEFSPGFDLTEWQTTRWRRRVASRTDRAPSLGAIAAQEPPGPVPAAAAPGGQRVFGPNHSPVHCQSLISPLGLRK